jgi:hypothetical protein
MRDSQACILSGGVYLRHRPRKASFEKDLLALLSPHGYYTSPLASVQPAAFGRAGVQETTIYYTDNKNL